MESDKDWMYKSYHELFSPLVMQFDRSANCYARYLKNKSYLNAKTLKQANSEILRLLMDKSSLIPEKLNSDALLLIDHLDVWFAQFEQLEKELNPHASSEFVFYRTAEGTEFPKQSELHFRAMKQQLKQAFSAENNSN
ncbi:MAG: hypothetical protein IPP56_00040 [Bacteroidetes bacterium]|nr:hypothetical protein [Bacteroidota bacterium]MBK9671123.1 hypothetical protein [Bacteroidota bacterium]MBK9798167.1 hypothetical protein [Bacteroidota bacterium]MBP6414114.1 hypothetical protein [Bacteroidia bacterium]